MKIVDLCKTCLCIPNTRSPGLAGVQVSAKDVPEWMKYSTVHSSADVQPPLDQTPIATSGQPVPTDASSAVLQHGEGQGTRHVVINAHVYTCTLVAVVHTCIYTAMYSVTCIHLHRYIPIHVYYVCVDVYVNVYVYVYGPVQVYN